MRKLCLTMLAGFVFLVVPVQASHAETMSQVKTRLIQEMEADVALTQDEGQRLVLVRDFVKALKGLDDLALGSPEVFAQIEKQAHNETQQAKLEQLRKHVKEMIHTYQTSVKPVLLNNVKFKRDDDFAKHNKGALSGLFAKTKANHRTGRPVSGILRYQTDISDSMFSEELVDAGLLVNFPELEGEPWVNQAQSMEEELLVLYRLHRIYLDGTKYEKAEQIKAIGKASSSKKSVSQKLLQGEDRQSLVATEASLAVMPVSSLKEATPETRVDTIHGFVTRLKKVDVSLTGDALKKELTAIVSLYQMQVKPILMDNVKLRREGDAAKRNSGELLSLFFVHRRNHHTGKPISGLLRYQQDTSSFFGEAKLEDAGLLVEHPELEQEKFIQDALTMESELIVLAEQHRQYLNQGTSIF